MVRRLARLVVALCLVAFAPGAAWADEVSAADGAGAAQADGAGGSVDGASGASSASAEVEVSADGDAARMEGCAFPAPGRPGPSTGSTMGTRIGWRLPIAWPW